MVLPEIHLTAKKNSSDQNSFHLLISLFTASFTSLVYPSLWKRDQLFLMWTLFEILVSEWSAFYSWSLEKSLSSRHFLFCFALLKSYLVSRLGCWLSLGLHCLLRGLIPVSWIFCAFSWLGKSVSTGIHVVSHISDPVLQISYLEVHRVLLFLAKIILGPFCEFIFPFVSLVRIKRGCFLSFWTEIALEDQGWAALATGMRLLQ